MDRGHAKIFAGGLLKTQKNLMLQARAYTMEVVMILRKDPAPKQPLGSPHTGNLIIPFGWGRVMTAITRKQFEGLVLTPRLGDMPKKGDDEADEARLLYVAMTRAIDRLVMTYRKPSRFTRKIQDSIDSVRQQLDEMDSQKVAG
ncbi:hypothetical protein [Pseudomonas thivervalensis]|uniref:hypothetical protein n=1 Tax=Pseudomonas TaxID=286 RepID=UPI003D9518BF